MTALVLAALIGISPAEAHATHKHQARHGHVHHHRSHRPQAIPNKRWVWVSGHWSRRGNSTVWIWGRWELRPAPNHNHVHHNRRCAHRH